MSHNEFWQLTYAEFIVRYEEHIKSQVHKRNELVFHAWHVAMFNRQKRLPALDTVLTKEETNKPKKAQTTEEMMSMCKMLNAAYGGKEIKT